MPAASDTAAAAALTATLLTRPRSNAQAMEQAQRLQAALQADREGTLRSMFTGWSRQYGKEYLTPDEAASALEAFAVSVDSVVRHNLEAAEGSWAALNDHSATPRQRLRSVLSSAGTAAACHRLSAPPGHGRQAAVTALSPPRPPRPPPPRPPSPRTALCTAELIQQRRCFAVSTIKKPQPVGANPNVTLPPPLTVNWVVKLKAPLVRNQGINCASSWAIAAETSIESAIAIVYNKPPFQISAQVFVDCANAGYGGPEYITSSGCSGGTSQDALLFASQFTIPLEGEYPYTSVKTGQQSTCKANLTTLPWKYDRFIQGYGVNYYPKGNELYVQAAVALQPIIIYWNIGTNWFTYAGGLYTIAQQRAPGDGCTTGATTVNHAMLVIGYTYNPNGTSWWLIQNSFGTTWGDKGRALVQMTGDINGPCGMYATAIAPIMAFRHVPPSIKVLNTTGLTWQKSGGPIQTGFHACNPLNQCEALWAARNASGVRNLCCQVSSVAISPDGLLVAAGLWDYTVRLWSVATRTLVATLHGHTDQIKSVSFSGDGTIIASGSADMRVRLWDVARRVLIGVLGGHTATVNCVAWSPDGRLLATGAGDEYRQPNDYSVNLWNVSQIYMNTSGSAVFVRKLNGHTRSVLGLAFSLDSTALVTGSADLTLRLWNTKTFLPFGGNQFAHKAPVTSVAISPDGKLLVSGSGDQTVRLWNIANISAPVQRGWFVGNKTAVDPTYSYTIYNGGRLKYLVNDTSHTKGVLSVAFSPDGASVASGSLDATLRVWKVTSLAQPVVTFRDTAGAASVSSIAFSNDGYTLVAGGYDNLLRLYALRPTSPSPSTG